MRSHSRRLLGILALVALATVACAPAAAPSPTTAPAKPAPTAVPAKPAEAKPTAAPAKPAVAPAAKPAEAKPAEAKPAAKGEDLSQLHEAARKEGKLVFYTGFNKDTAEQLMEQFKKKYPGIETEVFRAGSEQLIQKTLAESRAKRQIADITAHSQLAVLKREGLMLSYVPPEAAAYPANLKDKDGAWLGVDFLAFVVAHNTKQVKKEDAPKTYDALLDPKWKGQKIGLEQNGWDWMATLITEMGEQKGTEYMKKLAAQQPGLIDGNTTILEQQVAGEFALSINFLHSIEKLKEEGAPLDWTAPEPVPTSIQSIGIFKDAPHPNAAKLFERYMLSEEGQSFWASKKRVVGHPNVKGSLPQYLPNKKVAIIDPELSLQQQKWAEQFRSIFVR